MATLPAQPERGVDVQEQELKAYFDKDIQPKLVDGTATEQFEKHRAEIEKKLVGDRVDQALEAWLKEARGRTKIEFRPEAFQ
jgi:Na+-transporting NADH:ubiquinone oxidoreductase subunit NqrC